MARFPWTYPLFLSEITSGWKREIWPFIWDLQMPGVLIELQLGCWMSRDPGQMHCSHSAYLMHFQYTGFSVYWTEIRRTHQSPWHCCYVVHTAQLLTQISLGVKMPLESGPKFWSLVQNLKTLSQNTFIIGWSFSLQLHHSLISSLQLTSKCHGGMGCAWISSHTHTSQMCLYGIQLVGLITRSYQGIRTDYS